MQIYLKQDQLEPNLKKINAQNTNLEGANLEGANLEGANLGCSIYLEQI